MTIGLRKDRQKNRNGVVKNHPPEAEINVASKGLLTRVANDIVCQIVAYGDAPKQTNTIELAGPSTLHKENTAHQTHGNSPVVPSFRRMGQSPVLLRHDGVI
ncbi:hypothetical protein FISHEDRAFT_57016 [Fistulina hepatica ATCC 64428]|nr:hypothetical protein FISHEDRAFT_57016 [Fistulina hepatica ATCC 64428]